MISATAPLSVITPHESTTTLHSPPSLRSRPRSLLTVQHCPSTSLSSGFVPCSKTNTALCPCRRTYADDSLVHCYSLLCVCVRAHGVCSGSVSILITHTQRSQAVVLCSKTAVTVRDVITKRGYWTEVCVDVSRLDQF